MSVFQYSMRYSFSFTDVPEAKHWPPKALGRCTLGGDMMREEIRSKWSAFFEWKYLSFKYIKHYVFKYE